MTAFQMLTVAANSVTLGEVVIAGLLIVVLVRIRRAGG